MLHTLIARMTGWLVRFLWKEKEAIVAEDRYDLYKPAERTIYSYWDGQGVVQADPMEVYRRMADVSADLWADAQLAFSNSKNAGKGYDSFIARIRGIFKVKTFAEGGLTDPEANALLDHYLVFLDRVKKNSGPPPTSPGATSPTTPPPTAPSGSASLAEGPPSKNISGSGSTENAPSIAPPTPSQWAPPSPSVS